MTRIFWFYKKKALELADNPNTFLSTVQIGIILIGILTGIYSGEQITEDVKTFIVQFPLFIAYADSISVVIVLIMLTFFSIVFGDHVRVRPKANKTVVRATKTYRVYFPIQSINFGSIPGFDFV